MDFSTVQTRGLGRTLCLLTWALLHSQHLSLNQAFFWLLFAPIIFGTLSRRTKQPRKYNDSLLCKRNIPSADGPFPSDQMGLLHTEESISHVLCGHNNYKESFQLKQTNKKTTIGFICFEFFKYAFEIEVQTTLSASQAICTCYLSPHCTEMSLCTQVAIIS